MGVFYTSPDKNTWHCPDCDRDVAMGFACPGCRRDMNMARSFFAPKPGEVWHCENCDRDAYLGYKCPGCGQEQNARPPAPEEVAAHAAANVRQQVVITGVSIPFLDLVTLMVKVALAIVPAAFILAILFTALMPVLGGLLGKR